MMMLKPSDINESGETSKNKGKEKKSSKERRHSISKDSKHNKSQSRDKESPKDLKRSLNDSKVSKEGRIKSKKYDVSDFGKDHK